MPAPFRIVLPATVPASDRETLRLALHAEHATVQEMTEKDVTAALTTLVVVAGGVVAVTSAVSQSIDLVDKIAARISAWRTARAAAGAHEYGVLQRPDQPPLDLDPSRSSDAELLAWLRHGSLE